MTACLPNAATPFPTEAPTAAAQPQPSPTPVLALAPPTATLAAELHEIAPTPTDLPDPLRFVFPTQAFSPVSAWRPPLYETPWEPTPNDHFYFSRPIGADQVNWPLAIYRYGGIFFENTVHSGIDIPSPRGTPVLAAGDGEVIWAGWGLFFLQEQFNDPYGIAIAIKHSFGYQGSPLYTVYGHMDDYYVVRGQRVKQGDMIGIVGETGKTTGPHLHFEVRLSENDYYRSRNPELWIAPPQGWGILVGRILDSDGRRLEKHTIHIRSTRTNQYWFVITYGGTAVNSDDYYQENMVIGDLPAGEYVIWTLFNNIIYSKTIEVKPGQVTFVRFIGTRGFDLNWPSPARPNFTPPALEATPED